MTKLNELKPANGAVKTSKRKGRGQGSGNGKTAGRGEKGQKSRSGYSRKLYFEGGQTPLTRLVPKRGFNNPNKEFFNALNVGLFENFEEDTITPELLAQKGLIKPKFRVKILGDGTLTKPKTIIADKFSKTALEKIEAAKGKAEVINNKASNEKAE